MDAYGHLYRRVLYPFYESVVRRRTTLAKLREVEASEHFSHERLVAMQMRALQELVAHAKANVPFYRERLAGIDPHTLQSRSDLLRLPLLTRVDAQESSETRRSVVPPFVEITKSTSGSTGKPVAFGYERDSEDWRQAVRLRAYAWAGYQPGMRTFHFWGVGAKPPSRLKQLKVELDHRLRRDWFTDSASRAPARLDEVITELKRFRPEVIVCFTTAGADLARRVLATNARDWGTIPVICGAEALFAPDRAALEAAFGPAVFETYGSRETMLLGAECSAHAGLHVPMENVIVEVLVEENGAYRHAAPGESGDVAVTDLHNRAMPFLRYLNGDRAVAIDETPCACGRAHERLPSIDGRVTAVLRDRAGGPVGGLFVNVVMAPLGRAFDAFQVVQHTDDSVTVKLVKGATYDETARQKVVDGFARFLGEVPLAIELVTEIPVGRNGKRQVILRD